jgi:hypothetical protein
MARHYSTKDFFRQIPNALLARYSHSLNRTVLSTDVVAVFVASADQRALSICVVG